MLWQLIDEPLSLLLSSRRSIQIKTSFRFKIESQASEHKRGGRKHRFCDLLWKQQMKKLFQQSVEIVPTSQRINVKRSILNSIHFQYVHTSLRGRKTFCLTV